MNCDWRFYLTIIIMTLCVLDLVLTTYYVYTYKNWQPDKPYKQIELNPLLVFLWNRLGFTMGMIIGSIFILTLNWIICRYAHWSIVVIFLLVLSFTMFNHFRNINLLTKLIQMYPSGYLPESIFGIVKGNNK